MVSTLSTSKKVLLQLEYNHARDEIISGGSDGCFVWRLEAIPCELYVLGAGGACQYNLCTGNRALDVTAEESVDI